MESASQLAYSEASKGWDLNIAYTGLLRFSFLFFFFWKLLLPQDIAVLEVTLRHLLSFTYILLFFPTVWQ